MKLVFAILLLAFVTNISAQETQKPELVDEFGVITCEDLLARTDHLGLLLDKAKSSSAYIVFSSKDRSTKQEWQMEFIRRVLIARYGQKLNLTFLRKSDGGEARAKVWLVPAGTEFSRQGAEAVSGIPFQIDTKTLFAEEDPGACSGHIPQSFTEMLKSQESLTGYVVNINVPRAERGSTIRYFVDLFRKNGLSERGIRIYFKNRKLPPGYNYSFTEYWLVPTRRPS